MRYLSLREVLEIHLQVIQQSGGAPLIRDMGGLSSAVAQPRMTFDKKDLYSSVFHEPKS
jgi:death on curing protein